MGRETKASDWEFAGVLSGGISIVAAVSAWTFSFRSAAAAHAEDFILVTKGIATVGVSAEISWPDVEAEDLQWSSVGSKRPFSAKELDGSPACVVSGGVSAVLWGYSELLASAGAMTDLLFSGARNNGFGLGVQLDLGVSAGEYYGSWYSIGSVLKDYVIPPLKAGVVIAGVASGLFMAGEALLRGRNLAIRNAFFSGYAQGLADLTSDRFSESSTAWNLAALMRTDPAEVLRRELKEYARKGSSGASLALSAVRDAGQAFILQDVDVFMKSKGNSAYYAEVKRQQSLYGVRDSARQDRYFQLLEGQYRTKGFLFGARFGV